MPTQWSEAEQVPLGCIASAPSERGLSPQGNWGREQKPFILSLRHDLRS